MRPAMLAAIALIALGAPSAALAAAGDAITLPAEAGVAFAKGGPGGPKHGFKGNRGRHLGWVRGRHRGWYR